MKLAGFEIRVKISAVYSFLVMAIIFTVITVVVQSTTDIRESAFLGVILVALAAAGFHFFAQAFHTAGHAMAAWAVGYPMTGALFMYVFAMSLYPPDEPPLPDRVHIQRSLGGVLAFGLLLVIVLALWMQVRSAPQWTLRYLTTYMLINVSLLFAVSAGVSDGLLFVLTKGWRSPPSDETAAS